MPYNPGIQYRGDQYLFSGISGAGEEVAKGIQRYRQEKQESAEMNPVFERLMERAWNLAERRGTPEMLKEFAGFNAQSLGKKRGTIASLKFLVDEWNRDEQLAMTRENQRAVNERADKAVAIQQQYADTAAKAHANQAHFAQLIQQFTQPTPGPAVGGGGMMVPTLQRRQITPDVIASFMGESGVATPETMLPLMREQMEASRNRQPAEVTLAGEPVVYSPHTGQFQVVRPGAGTDGELGAQPVKDQNGQIIGYNVPSGRGGGTTFVRSQPAIPPDGTPVPGMEQTHVYVNGRAVKRDAVGETLQRVNGGLDPRQVRNYDPVERKLMP